MLILKIWSHLFIASQATGKAISVAIVTSFKNSLDSNPTTVCTEAPSTFLTPISFFRRSAVKIDKPNKPRQATKMEIKVKMPNTVPIRCSERYNASNSLSRKLKIKGAWPEQNFSTSPLFC